MYRIFSFVLLLLASFGSVHAQEYVRQKRVERDGYVWQALSKGSLRGAANKQGKIVVPVKFDNAFYSTSGGCFYARTGKYTAVYDLTGKCVIGTDRKYDNIAKLSLDVKKHGTISYYRVERIFGKRTYVGICDASGKEIISPSRGYSSVYMHHSNGMVYCDVYKGKLRGACDASGREVVAPGKKKTVIYSDGTFKYKSGQKYKSMNVTLPSTSSAAYGPPHMPSEPKAVAAAKAASSEPASRKRLTATTGTSSAGKTTSAAPKPAASSSSASKPATASASKPATTSAAPKPAASSSSASKPATTSASKPAAAPAKPKKSFMETYAENLQKTADNMNRYMGYRDRVYVVCSPYNPEMPMLISESQMRRNPYQVYIPYNVAHAGQQNNPQGGTYGNQQSSSSYTPSSSRSSSANGYTGNASSDTDFNKGANCYKAQNYKEAVRWFQKAAEAGDADAQYMMGVCYCEGEGVVKNPAKAFYWYKKAAEAGHVVAQFDLGVCYDTGNGVVKNSAKAFYWYKKAAEADFVAAQYNLGVCYDTGNGVVKDMAKAVYWYKKAAKGGWAKAQYNLGIAYKNGEGVAKNEKEAFALFRRAAEQGLANAQYQVGRSYDVGTGGVTQNKQEAIKWYEKAAMQGNSNAMFRLGVIYFGKDNAKAKYWIEKGLAIDNESFLAAGGKHMLNNMQ